MEKKAVSKEKKPVKEKTISPTRKKVNKVLGIVVNVILVIAIALAALCTFISYRTTSGSGVPNIFGIIPARVLSDSMEPTFYEGDLVIDVAVGKNFDYSTLKPAGADSEGDIITFWTYINGERTLNTHRITNVYDGGDHLIFETKGDNNSSADYLTVHESEIVGIYKFAVSGLGSFVGYLQEPVGFGLIILLPVFLFFVYHLIQFFRVLFEYQNTKNRLKYEQERGRTEDLIEQQTAGATEQNRTEIEAEVREKVRAELQAEMQKNSAEKGEADKPAGE